MATFLVYYNDVPADPDPERDKWLYKKGDIVAMYEDGVEVGPIHSGSPYVIIRVPGLETAVAQAYLEERFEGPVDGDGFASASERRHYQIDFSKVNQSVINQLNSTKDAEVQLSKVRQYIRDKKTGQYEA